jgi:hypothetical protein
VRTLYAENFSKRLAPVRTSIEFVPNAAVGLVPTGAAGEVDDLVAFDVAGARGHRERPDTGDVVDLEGRCIEGIAGSISALDAALAHVTRRSSRMANSEIQVKYRAA